MVNGVTTTRYRWFTEVSLVFCGVMLFATLPALATQLSNFEWQKRPLLIFAPNHHDDRLQKITDHLRQKRCDLDDRDMIIGIIVKQGRSSLDDLTLSPQNAAAMRGNYRINNDQFAVLLIGKDGGEKYRLYDIPDLDEIFVMIDGMPMRQDEMQDNPVDCSK